MSLLDWRLRRVMKKYGVPDLPETRRLCRLSYWNGFTFGVLKHEVKQAREEALDAMARERHWEDYVDEYGYG